MCEADSPFGRLAGHRAAHGWVCRMIASSTHLQKLLIVANVVLLILFPIAWFAPLMKAGLLPLFGLSEISVISGLQSLWESDVFLALLVNLV